MAVVPIHSADIGYTDHGSSSIACNDYGLTAVLRWTNDNFYEIVSSPNGYEEWITTRPELLQGYASGARIFCFKNLFIIPFSWGFFTSSDLLEWTEVSEVSGWPGVAYSQSPGIPFAFDGTYYFTYTAGYVGEDYTTSIRRSLDLLNWTVATSIPGSVKLIGFLAIDASNRTVFHTIDSWVSIFSANQLQNNGQLFDADWPRSTDPYFIAGTRDSAYSGESEHLFYKWSGSVFDMFETAGGIPEYGITGLAIANSTAMIYFSQHYANVSLDGGLSCTVYDMYPFVTVDGRLSHLAIWNNLVFIFINRDGDVITTADGTFTPYDPPPPINPPSPSIFWTAFKGQVETI